MSGLFELIVPLFAAKPAPGGAGDSFLPSLVFIGPMLLFFYLLIIRPQQQAERRRRNMVDAVKKNDEVVTTSGIYGTVVSIDPEKDKVIVRIDDDKGVRVAFRKSAIAQVIDPAADKSSKPA